MEDTAAMFDRLAELVDQIPAMQAKNDRLARDTAARKVIDSEMALRCREAELHEGDRLVEEAERALEAIRAELGDSSMAQDEPSTALVEAQTRFVHAGLARGMRVGPFENARSDFESALAGGGFSSVDEARAALVSEDDRAAVEREIADFKSEYDRVLAVCEAAGAD